MFRRFLPLVLGAALCGTAAAQTPAPTPAPAARPSRPAPLILVSIDGFRADYFDRGLTPNLAALAADGVRAREGMRPSFPSITFPNHYTLVTGLFPDHHGIVANTMEDPRIVPDSRFTLGTYAAVSDGRWWNEARPLWVTAKHQGLRTATMFWPGSEAPIGGVRPDFWTHFDQTFPPELRVDILLNWLDQPQDKRPAFATLYFDQVDTAGHEHGPDSPELTEALRRTDAAIGRLVSGLKQRGLYELTNLVIVADHGMASTPPSQVVALDDLAPKASVHVVSGGATAGLEAKGPQAADAERALIGKHDHFTCWRKQDLPARWHFGTNARVPPIYCVAQIGWLLETREGLARRKSPMLGEHGYDNAEPLMRALFIAHGPAFRKGVLAPVFDNVDVYPLLAEVLGVRPEHNDGALAEVAGMLSAAPAPQP